MVHNSFDSFVDWQIEISPKRETNETIERERMETKFFIHSNILTVVHAMQYRSVRLFYNKRRQQIKKVKRIENQNEI